ncbi:uncharacterized protein LOC111902932 isoform X2 [Lactuca sativa]|uniref:uncharacterized protein LOC111902932 isoform X2 n=1 Tax=Lactuca sativa TaxID=4236 RepID=UPI001C691167|nr:uncharacterized protein LOC111902932 isoform X2 [Lactuca sativa]
MPRYLFDGLRIFIISISQLIMLPLEIQLFQMMNQPPAREKVPYNLTDCKRWRFSSSMAKIHKIEESDGPMSHHDYIQRISKVRVRPLVDDWFWDMTVMQVVISRKEKKPRILFLKAFF